MNSFLRLEKCLLPPPVTVRWNKGTPLVETYSLPRKVAHCVKNLFVFIALVAVLPCTLVYDWATKKPLVIKKTPNIVPDVSWPPKLHGFATSLFQTSGLGTKWAAAPKLEGKCDWDKWMDKPEHIIHEKGFEYKSFFTDILSDPAPYIKMLKENNVTSQRFSLEWSVIEPTPGKIDNKAVAVYRNFISALIEEGITPTVTLNHFVLPEWFYESGSFQKMDNVDRFVSYGIKVMELFPEVKDWWSFNELGVKAFQQTREVYPTDVPEGTMLPTRMHAAAISTMHMIIAHCKLHQAVQAKGSDQKLGVTHQWLKFDTASGNWLERLMAYIFTKCTFTPVYNFFKEGKFSFEVPFMTNVQFEIPQEEFKQNNGFLTRIGVQAYPQPMLKMGLNHGQTYPGIPGAINNLPFFSFGSTCEPSGTVMRFGPRWKPERMQEILDDAFALGKPVYITEFGSDAMVQKWGKKGFELNEEAQAEYLKDLTEQVRNYCQKNGKELGGIYCWSDLRKQLEWDNGFACQLGIITAVADQNNRKLLGWQSTPASRYLASVFAPESSTAAAAV